MRETVLTDGICLDMTFVNAAPAVSKFCFQSLGLTLLYISHIFVFVYFQKKKKAFTNPGC